MKNLTVNGVDFQGELPGEWTLQQLVSVLEREVLQQGELVTSVEVDGMTLGQGDFAKALAEVEDVTITAEHLTNVVSRAVLSSKQSLTRFEEELNAAIDSFQVGQEPQGWAAYQRSLGTLGIFVDVAERIISVLRDAFEDGDAKADEIQSFSNALTERLREMEQASADEDVITLCDCAEELTSWTHRAWEAVWPTEQQA